jgi:phosphohistidine swiveling domain-containing protein
VSIDQAPVATLPVPDHFPVEWDGEREATLFFRQARDHFPRPIAPLDFSYFKQALEYGVEHASDRYHGPIVGWHLRRFNTYFYQAMVPHSPEEADRRTQRLLEMGDELLSRASPRWHQEILPEVEAHIAWWDAFDLEHCSDAELVRHLEETWARGRRLWELHFDAISPAYVALSEFEELFRELFGQTASLDAFRLLQGFPTKNLEIGEGLWRLSRIALDSPDVQAALNRERTDAVLAALDGTRAGRGFRDELMRYLETYGKRGDTWVLSAPSWLENPSMVLKNLRDLISAPRVESPMRATERAARERERLLARTRARLAGYPAAAREEFETFLAAAQAATVIQDDHNFFIDFCSTYRVRRAILAAGQRLADRDTIDERDDVFMLELDELVEALETQPGIDRRELVAERRGEMERFSSVEPPAMLGSLPTSLPLENPVFRFMMKFYGVPPVPSEEPDVVTGLAGSSGKARGTARILLSIAEADKLRPGDVLIAETTAPPWTPLFATAAAVVSDSGGILSHCAVVAREYGIPAVVGTGLATRAIRDGQIVEVDGDAGVVRVVSQPSSSGDGGSS